MAFTTTEPGDIDTLRQVCLDMVAEGRSEEAIEAAISLCVRLVEHNAELALRIKNLLRDRVGRRSEKVSAEQLSLMMQLLGEDAAVDPEELAAADAGDETEEDDEGESEGEAVARRKPRRQRPPEHLPRKDFSHELSETERVCEGCGDPMPKIGEDESELIELIPVQFVVHRHRRAKYACGKCKDAVVTAPGPDKLIDGGLAGPGLLAHVAVSKFQDHTPLRRLQGIYARHGVHLGIATLCAWVAAVAREVEPLVDRIWSRVLDSYLIQTDASGLKVLDRDHSEGIRRGTIWAHIGDARWCVFRYAKTGSGEDGPWKFLAGREGYIQADAASVFDRLFNGELASATEVGCWAHARRKFFKLKDSDHRVAYPLQLMQKMFRVERQAADRGLSPDERRALRRKRSARLTEKLQRWLVAMTAREPPQSAMAKACAYALNHWKALTRFLEDGALPLTNNLCELQIRSLALGRKNYYFAGNDDAGEHAATLYSLLRTCALHDVPPMAYLKDVLQKLASGWKADRLDELLPDAWAREHAVEVVEVTDDSADEVEAA